jgi:hypothetical protein
VGDRVNDRAGDGVEDRAGDRVDDRVDDMAGRPGCLAASRAEERRRCH